VSRSPAINQHGDISKDDVTAVVVFGITLYVDRAELAGSRVMLRQFKMDGRLAGRMNVRARTWTPEESIHRDNIGSN
jgi:hypothetical protein